MAKPKSRQQGALLLTVSLLLAIMAALAFTLGRGAGMDARSVMNDYHRRNLAYLAEAAVAAAKWTNQVPRCGAPPIAPFSFAGATLSATVAPAGPRHVSVTGTATTSANGSATGGSASLTRPSIALFDITHPENKNLGGDPRDTTIDSTLATPQNTGKTLKLTSGQSYALLYWPMTDITDKSEVLSATLSLFQNGGSPVARTLSLQRITSNWDPNATWTRATPKTNWNTSGGDYRPVAAASATIAPSSTSLPVTDLVEKWYTGVYPDNGMLLQLPTGGQSASFYSLEAGGNQRPILNVIFAKACP